MSILLIIWLVIAVISITYYLVSTSKHEPKSEDTGKGEYSAVTIDFGKSDACPAVMRIFGQRFLGEDAPALPLFDCTAEVCSCTFRHYDDRRAGPRRAYEKSVVSKLYGGIENRSEPRGRRLKNWPACYSR